MMLWMLPILIAFGAADAEAANGSDKLAGRVAAIVTDLANDAYEVRERAQKQLNALPAEALPIISRAYQRSDDAEVRMRLRLYADAYFEKHILRRFSAFRRPGFLGIVQQEGLLEDGSGYVEITRVMPGTGAEAAGLRAGDKLIAMNGNALPAGGATMAVAKYVQAHFAGAEMKCTIIRDNKQMDITAVLGGLPDEHLDADKRERLEQARRDLKQQWWERGFVAGNLDFLPQDREPLEDEPQTHRR
jgi:hypothetical protein